MNDKTKSFILMIISMGFISWSSYLIKEPKVEWVVAITIVFIIGFGYYCGRYVKSMEDGQ